MDPYKILDRIVKAYKGILGTNLVGVYLHGSLAMGCYTDSSDIDFLVVVKEPMDHKTKRELIEAILYIEGLPKKGLEMSVILERYARDFVYPTPFELHYSDFHRKRYIADENYICGGFTDPDLAAHITIVKHRGVCLYGKKIDEVFCDVPRQAYIEAIFCDIADAKHDIFDNSIYVVLNLCRVLYYLKENVICSKLEGGNWGKASLPPPFGRLVEDALNVYMGCSHAIEWKKDDLAAYADYMMNEINTIYLTEKV